MTRLCVGTRLSLRQLISLPVGKQSRVYHSLGGLHHHTPSRHLITGTERNVKVTERRGVTVRDESERVRERGKEKGREMTRGLVLIEKAKLCGLSDTTTRVRKRIAIGRRARVFQSSRFANLCDVT